MSPRDESGALALLLAINSPEPDRRRHLIESHAAELVSIARHVRAVSIRQCNDANIPDGLTHAAERRTARAAEIAREYGATVRRSDPRGFGLYLDGLRDEFGREARNGWGDGWGIG